MVNASMNRCLRNINIASFILCFVFQRADEGLLALAHQGCMPPSLPIRMHEIEHVLKSLQLFVRCVCQ